MANVFNSIRCLDHGCVTAREAQPTRIETPNKFGIGQIVCNENTLHRESPRLICALCAAENGWTRAKPAFI
jgi:hypothetical protein